MCCAKTCRGLGSERKRSHVIWTLPQHPHLLHTDTPTKNSGRRPTTVCASLDATLATKQAQTVCIYNTSCVRGLLVPPLIEAFARLGTELEELAHCALHLCHDAAVCYRRAHDARPDVARFACLCRLVWPGEPTEQYRMRLGVKLVNGKQVTHPCSPCGAGNCGSQAHVGHDGGLLEA
jgi:hypothetical protein